MTVEPLGAIALLWNMLEGVAKGYKTQKKEVFENHIEPLQERMTEIHKDYISGFEEVRRILKNSEKPSPELLEFLYERRRDYEQQRQMANDLASNLAKLHRVGIKTSDMEAIKSYATAIVEYCSASGRVGTYSWFTDFLSIVESNIRMGFDSIWNARFSISGNPQEDLIKLTDDILNQGLPNAFRKISSAYANLRTRFI